MIRVSMHDGRLSVDPRAGGRGAWLCPEIGCCDQARKRNALSRALRTEIPHAALDGLREEVVTGTVFPLDPPFVKR